jgi:cytochrome P450
VSDDTTPDDIADAMAALAPTVREMNAYFGAHVQHCRAHPRDDLTSRLVAADIDGQRLADIGGDEILSFVGSLMSAEHITMTAMLTSAIVLLDQHSDAAAEVRADPTLRTAALEEVLRCRPGQVGRSARPVPAPAPVRRLRSGSDHQTRHPLRWRRGMIASRGCPSNWLVFPQQEHLPSSDGTCVFIPAVHG